MAGKDRSSLDKETRRRAAFRRSILRGHFARAGFTGGTSPDIPYVCASDGRVLVQLKAKKKADLMKGRPLSLRRGCLKGLSCLAKREFAASAKNRTTHAIYASTI
jgi:hypothetical protein